MVELFESTLSPPSFAETLGTVMALFELVVFWTVVCRKKAPPRAALMGYGNLSHFQFWPRSTPELGCCLCFPSALWTSPLREFSYSRLLLVKGAAFKTRLVIARGWGRGQWEVAPWWV